MTQILSHMEGPVTQTLSDMEGPVTQTLSDTERPVTQTLSDTRDQVWSRRNPVETEWRVHRGVGVGVAGKSEDGESDTHTDCGGSGKGTAGG